MTSFGLTFHCLFEDQKQGSFSAAIQISRTRNEDKDIPSDNIPEVDKFLQRLRRHLSVENTSIRKAILGWSLLFARQAFRSRDGGRSSGRKTVSSDSGGD